MVSIREAKTRGNKRQSLDTVAEGTLTILDGSVIQEDTLHYAGSGTAHAAMEGGGSSGDLSGFQLVVVPNGS